MTGFEVLAYIASFAILFLIITFVGLGVYMYIERKKFLNDFLERREKMGGNLNANSSVKEKR